MLPPLELLVLFLGLSLQDHRSLDEPARRGQTVAALDFHRSPRKAVRRLPKVWQLDGPCSNWRRSEDYARRPSRRYSPCAPDWLLRRLPNCSQKKRSSWTEETTSPISGNSCMLPRGKRTLFGEIKQPWVHDRRHC